MTKEISIIKGYALGKEGETLMDKPLWYVRWGYGTIEDDEGNEKETEGRTKKFDNFKAAEAFMLKKVAAGYKKGRCEQ